MESSRSTYKGMVFVFIFFSLMIIPHYARADYQTNLYFSGYVQDQAAGGDLSAGAWSAPTVYDWDNDGAKDLLVGMKSSGVGYVKYYRNIGTDDDPSFNGYIDIQACDNTCLLNVPATGG